MAIVTRQQIDAFLQGKQIAVIGVSRKEKSYSRMLFRELIRHGYDAYPINPNGHEFEGIKSHSGIETIQPAPEYALILLSGKKSDQAVMDCAEAGVKHLWLYRPAGRKGTDSPVVRRAMEMGINVVAGHCLFMFLQGAPGIHKFHGRIMKWLGRYPE